MSTEAEGVRNSATFWRVLGFLRPYKLTLFLSLLLALVRLGWRRFGRLLPTWVIATIISIMS